MNTYGIYIYAHNTIFPKVKKYIDVNYNTVATYGASNVACFSRDFLTKNNARNLKSVVIINTQEYSPQLVDEYNLVVKQISMLQTIMKDKLIITVLYTDNRIISVFNPLRSYSDINLAQLNKDGVTNELIDKIIIAPVIKDAPRYIEPAVKVHPLPPVQDTNPEDMQGILPIKPEFNNPINVNMQFESETSFTTVLKNIHEDLKTMELSLEVGAWSSKELHETLETLENSGSLNNIDAMLEAKSKPNLREINERLSQTEMEIKTYEQLYAETKDEAVSAHLGDLARYKEGLEDAKEIANIQNKITFYKALQDELIHESNKSIEGSQESLRELHTLSKIKDSEEKIELLTQKRNELFKQMKEFSDKFRKQYISIEAEINSQEKLLISQATERKEELNQLKERISNADEYSSEKLKTQFALDKEALIILTNEIKKIQEDKTNFVAKCNTVIKGYQTMNNQLQQIVNVQGDIINEYETLTEKLKETKRIEITAKDNLSTKLDTFIGVDGVGKTTVAINYCQTLIALNKTVCIVDLDTSTPELQYYTEEIPVTQELADFVNMETSIDGLSELKTYNNSVFIINSFPNDSVLNKLDNCDTKLDMMQNVLDKLEILSRVFDKIIVIIPNTIDNSTEIVYERTGKWFYVTDLNPSVLHEIANTYSHLKSLDSKKYYKFIINKCVAIDTALISSRLGITSSFNPYTINFSNNLVMSKLNGQIATKVNPNLNKMFSFK